MRFSEKMRLFTLWIFLIGFTSTVLGQGGRRIVRVRKTGVFGKRIAPIATFYQPPTRQFSPSDSLFQGSETRRSDRIVGIPKPSQKLELPSFGHSVQDSVAEETGESPQGYAYPDQSPASGGYDYNPPAPAAEYPHNEGEDPEPQYEDQPSPVKPDKEAEFENDSKKLAFGVQSEKNVDSENVTPAARQPSPVKNSPIAEISDTSAQCDEHDHDCWPHGYKGEIPGEAGQDYPILSEIIDTPFDCNNVQYSGYYADTDDQARCQQFHICLKGNQYRKTQKWTFLCPNGTLFSQNDFVCVWWNNAPECNSGVVDELSLRNAELGWDNLTETGSGSSNNFDVRSAMSSLLNTNLQQSSSNSRLKNTLPPATRRPAAPSSRTSIPYRVPVKVNTGIGARTKLKEVSNNGLQVQDEPDFGVEHDGEESETYETSLSHQSEARRKTKTASALLKSESEAYEQKSVSDSVAPLLVNRQPVETDNANFEIPQQGNYEDEEGVPALVMMPSQKRNPDGSDGYAEVPVMINSGYKYPNPNSTPGPKYLPPQNEYSAPSTTEAPTTTTQIPSTEGSYDAQGGYEYQTTEQPSFSPQLIETTTEQVGYNYPAPSTTTEQAGYNYPAPSTTTEEAGYSYSELSTTEQAGYNYPSPSTTTEQSGYQYPTTTTTEKASQKEEISSPAYEDEEEGGYAYELTTVPESTTQRKEVTTQIKEVTTPSTTTTVQSEQPAGGYLPPKTGGVYNSLVSSAALQAPTNTVTLPNTDESLDDLVKKLPLTVTNKPDAAESSDYTDATEELDENEVTEMGGYGDKAEATPAYHLPTPATSPVGPTTGDNLDSQDKVNKILQEIQNGGAEVRDETGKKIDYAELQKLILSTPNGLLALQKADPSVTDSSASSSTEVPTSTLGTSTSAASVEPNGSDLETIQTVEDIPDNRAPASFLPQENYFTNHRVVNVKHPSYEISAPSKEYENHSVDQNSIDSGRGEQQRNSFSGYTSYETQPPQSNVNYPRPQTEFVQNFVPTQYTPTREVFYQRQRDQSEPQQQFRVQQQSQAPAPEVSYIRPSSISQPETYYQQQPTPQVQPETTYFRQQQQQQQIQQSERYYQPQQQANQQTFFQEQRQTEAPQYLPPAPSTSQAQIYNNPTPTQSRVIPQPRDLTDNIQLQQSYSFPIPQASTNSRKLANPIDIKIVPALFVHQHTRVENPDGSQFNSASATTSTSQRSNNFQKQNPSSSYHQPTNNLNSNNSPSTNGQFSVQASNSAYLPYTSQTENVPVKVPAPRLNPFSTADALPKYEPFTAEDGRTAEQIQQKYSSDLPKFQRENIVSPTQAARSSYSTTSTKQPSSSLPFTRRNERHFIGSGSTGQLQLPSNEQSSILNNFYPGRDGSLGVKLTYN